MRRYTVEVEGTAFTIDVEETAADRFRVTVGDRTFEAELRSDEDLPGAVIVPGMLPGASPAGVVQGEPWTARAAAPAAVAGPSAPDAPGVAAVPRAQAGTPRTSGTGSRADVLSAPMPGVILEVHARVGDLLARGDPVLVLEAMKMRNTIRAPRAGVVASMEVEAGQPVGPGDPLVRLGPAPG